MKKIIFTLTIFVVSSFTVFSQQLKPEVDENIELMGIVARLAGHPEFNGFNMEKYSIGLYGKNIDEYFAPFKEHEVIKMMQSMRQECGIVYNAVPSFGTHIIFKGNRFKKIEEQDSTIDFRWNYVDKAKFLYALTDFYKKAKFHTFFRSQKEIYDKAIAAYERDVMPLFDNQWHSKFFGMESDMNFRIIIGCTNGPCNYGDHRHLKGVEKDAFAIMGYMADSLGNPVDLKGKLNEMLIVHEFNHTYVNQVVESPENLKLLRESGEKIFSKVEDVMTKNAYGNWVYMMNEAIVRTSELLYMKEHNYPDEVIQAKYQREKGMGFGWLKGLAGCLNEYSKNRDKYPTFKDYYPVIIKFYDELAKKNP